MARFLPTVLALVMATVAWAQLPATAPAGAAVRDDTEFLRRQMVMGGVVTIPPGTYVTTRPVMLTNVSDLTVFAYGVTVQADAKQSTKNSLVGDMFQLRNCRRIRILGMSFDGNRTARGGFANDPQTIHLISCTDVTIRDCSFTGDVCDGVFAWGGLNPKTADAACQRLTIDSCRFRDPGRSCVSLVGAAWCNVTGNDFEGPGGDPGVAVDVEANTGDPAGINHHITIANNRCRNLKSAFFVVKTATPSGVIIVGNQVDSTKGDGIFNEGRDTIITANNVTNTGRVGVSQVKPGTGQITTNNGTIHQGR
jgi:parallel beta helix pectate lyase-like protein